MNPVQAILMGAVRVYRGLISPVLAGVFAPMGLGCRFSPTCSQYALDALQQHGALHGSWLAGRRLCRCHPWGGHGEDPVPLPKSSAASSSATPLSTLTTCRNGS